MKTIIFLLLYNCYVECVRFDNPEYFTVKEIKIKKLEYIKKIHMLLNYKGF